MNPLEYFEKEHITLPYLPESTIISFQEGVFGSKEPHTSLYDLEAYVKELLSHPVNDYVLFGFAGHGINSRAIHYYAVHENIALFIQLAFGGIASSDRDSLARVNAIFKTIGKFFKPKRALSKRLLVIQSDFYGSGWGWIEGCPGALDEHAWHAGDTAFISALNELQKQP